MRDASFPSATTYFSAGGNPATIEFCTSRELFARISNHILHNLEWGGRSEGPQGRQQDAVEFGVPLGTDPLLPERVLLDCRNQRWEYMARIQCHIIRVAESNGATSGYLVSVRNMTYQVLLHTG
jgi:hypothetical protein